MTDAWEKFEDVGNQASAEVLVGRLHLDGIPAQVERISPLPGLDEGFRVMVPIELAHRARSILESIDTTELETEEDPHTGLMSVVFYGGALGFPLATFGLFLAADAFDFHWGWGHPIVNAVLGLLLGFPVAAMFLYFYCRRSSARS